VSDEDIISDLPSEVRRVMTLRKVYQYPDALIAFHLHLPLARVQLDMRVGLLALANRQSQLIVSSEPI
jgi:DNA-directed RNA polymerase specialized sigma24 family protein